MAQQAQSGSCRSRDVPQNLPAGIEHLVGSSVPRRYERGRVGAALPEIASSGQGGLKKIPWSVGQPNPARNRLRRMIENCCPVLFHLNALEGERGIGFKSELRQRNLHNRERGPVHKTEDEEFRTLKWGRGTANGKVRMAGHKENFAGKAPIIPNQGPFGSPQNVGPAHIARVIHVRSGLKIEVEYVARGRERHREGNRNDRDSYRYAR